MINRRAVLTGAAQALAQNTDRAVGKGKRPDGDPEFPYYVMHLIDHTLDGAPLTDENEDAGVILQITCIAEQLDQALWAADRATLALLGRDPTTGLWLYEIPVEGAKVWKRASEAEPGDTSDPSAAIVSYVLRIRLDLTTVTA